VSGRLRVGRMKIGKLFDLFLVSYIESGPFSSQAPTEDTTFSQLPAEDLNLLRSAYGDEVGAQYALRLVKGQSLF